MSGVCVAICVFTSDPGGRGTFVLGCISIAELLVGTLASFSCPAALLALFVLLELLPIEAAGECAVRDCLAGVLRLLPAVCLCLGGAFGGSFMASLIVCGSFA